MQVKTYAKTRNINVSIIVDELVNQYKGTWLSSTRLQPQAIAYLDSVFGNPQQLPPAKETLQLPPSEKSDLTLKTDSQEISQSEAPQQKPSHLTQVNQITEALSTLEQIRLQQTLDDHYSTLQNTLNRHDEKIEALLLGRLQSNYEAIQNHQPVVIQAKDSTEVTSFIELLKAKGLVTDKSN
jgi:hypothetical protein